MWFKTRTTVGGQLIGFGSHTIGASSGYDRTFYMLDNGFLRFGVNPGTPASIVSNAALNDDAWHHVAASLGPAGMRMYVDGVLQTSQNAGITTGQSISPGYWRIGGDDLAGHSTVPSSYYFSGWIDDVAMYDKELTPDKISAHYHSRDR